MVALMAGDDQRLEGAYRLLASKALLITRQLLQLWLHRLVHQTGTLLSRRVRHERP